MRRSPLALVGAAVLAAGLAYGGGTALAQTTTCPALTAAQSIRDQAFTADANADQAVTEAQATLDTATSKLTAARRTLRADLATLATLQGASQAVTEAGGVPTDNLVTPVNGITTLTGLQGAITAAQNKVGDDQAAVTAAQGPVTAARTALTAAKAKAADTQAALDQAQTVLNNTTCPAPAGAPAPGDPGTQPAPGGGGDPVFTDDKNCGDFATQADAQAYFLTHRSAAQPDPDHLDGNGNGIACEVPADVTGPSSSTTVVNVPNVVVNPAQDDGSTATTSGTEVKVVPDGSAQTGG